MLYKYSETELKALLKSIVILVDTREQQNNHIIDYFVKNKLSYKLCKLDYADYSCYLPQNEGYGVHRDIYFTDTISIERKANLGELAANLAVDRSRLENEFIKHSGKLILLIENADYSQLIRGDYNSKYTPKAFTASIKTFESRYNIQTIFLLNKECSGNYIYTTMFYHVREAIKKGKHLFLTI